MNQLFALFFVLSVAFHGQAQSTKDSSVTLLTITSGLDFTGVRGGNFGEIQPSFGITLGKKLANNLYLFIGVDFSNYRFSSDPFLQSHTAYTQGAFVTTTDTFHTVYHNRTKYIGLPFKLRYQNHTKVVSSYFALGVIPSYNHWDIEFYQELLHPEKTSEIKIDKGKGSGLFGTAEVGVSYNTPKWGVSLGLSSNYLLLRSSLFQEKLYSIGGDLSLTKKITPEKKHTSSSEIRSPRKKMNAFYLELMGAGLLYSLNYERALIKTKLVSVHVRVGANLSYHQEDKPDSSFASISTKVFPDSSNLFRYGNRFLLPHYIPLSLASTFGEVNKIELGMGFSYNPVGSAGRDSFIFGEIGYRREDEKNVLFRLTFTPILEMNTNDFSPYVGISLGKRF